MRKSAAPSSKFTSGPSNRQFINWPSNVSTQQSVSSKPKNAVPAAKAAEATLESKADSSNKPFTARSTASILELLAGKQSWEEDSPENSPVTISEKENISAHPPMEKCPVVKPEPEKSSESVTFGMRIFTVVWGKPTTKKHKTWEGDGTLEVEDTIATLKDETGKILGRASKIKPSEFEEGKRLKVGSKEVELIELLSSAAAPAPAKRPREEDRAPATDPTRGWKKAKKSGGGASKLPMLRKMQPDPNPLQMRSPSSIHQWEFNTGRLPVVPVLIDGFLSTILRPHQRIGVSFLYDCVTGQRNTKQRGAILADEMGLGKTLQCITLIWTILKQGPYGGKPVARRVLVVSPSSLVQNWQNEFDRWLGRHRLQTFLIDQKNRPSHFAKYSHVPVMIVSYEMLIRHFEEIRKIKFELLICDEGHRLKNSNIRTSVLLSQLEINARVILTGTPIQNDLQEYFALVDFVNPGVLGGHSEFRRYFEEPIVGMQQPDASEDVISLGRERAEQLNARTGGFILRRTQDVIDKYLPKKTETVIFVKPSRLQLALYHTALEWWANENFISGSGESATHLLVMTTLKKLCNHPSLAIAGPSSTQDTQADPPEQSGLFSALSKKYNDVIGKMEGPLSSFYSGKLLVVQGILESIAAFNEKIVLVSYFTQTLDLLGSLCDELRLSYCRLDGSTPAAQRLSIVNQFNAAFSKTSVFLLSARAGGVGLNLTGASRLVLFDSDWNPANDLQAMSRVWRDGQRRDVYIYRLLTCGTIEEKIFQRQLSKTGLSGSVVDPNSQGGVRMSQAELKDLFTPHTGESSLAHESLDCACSGRGTVPDAAFAFTDPVDDKDDRACQIKLGSSRDTSTPCSNKLSMNQLMLWQHFAPPFEPLFLQELALSSVAQNLIFIFCNPSTPPGFDNTDTSTLQENVRK